MTDMTAEQALADLVQYASLNEVGDNSWTKLRGEIVAKALTAPRVPEGFVHVGTIRPSDFQTLDAMFGGAPMRMAVTEIGPSTIRSLPEGTKLYAAAPAPADSDPMPMPLFQTMEGEKLAAAAARYAELLEKHQEVLDTVQQCACAYDGPQDVCVGHAKELATLRERVRELEVALIEVSHSAAVSMSDELRGHIDGLISTDRLRGGSDE